MAQRRVPASYDTIADAVAASSNGDVIIVSDGTYSEWVSSSLTYITIEAERPGCNVVITGDFVVGVGWTFKGLHIIHALAESGIFTPYNGVSIEELHVLDCKLGLDDNSFAYFYLGNDAYTYRTEFYMVDGATQIDGIEFSTAGGVTFNFWQSCLFHDITSADALFNTPSLDKLYNCTFVNCDSTGYDYLVEPHTVQSCIFSSCTADVAIVASSTASSYDYNCFYDLTGTPNEGSLATHEFVGNPLLDSNYHPTAASPCRAYTGNTTPYSQCYVSLDKVAYDSANGPIGAFTYISSAGSMLYLKHINIDPCAGFYVTYYAETALASMENSYTSPFELAWAVECSMSHSMGGTHLAYFIYDLSGHYRSFANTIRTAVNTVAYKLFGAMAATAFTDSDVTVGPMTNDPNAYLLDALINEDLQGFVSSGQVDHYNNGAIRAMSIPSNSNTRMLSFDGISNKEDVLETHTLYHLLGLYVNGMPMRVYREWPTNLNRWSTTNRTGFDDIITPDAYNIDFPWHSNVLRRYTFKFEGLVYA